MRGRLPLSAFGRFDLQGPQPQRESKERLIASRTPGGESMTNHATFSRCSVEEKALSEIFNRQVVFFRFVLAFSPYRDIIFLNSKKKEVFP